MPLEARHEYAKKLPQATIREITSGGHQLGNDLAPVAEDIQNSSLKPRRMRRKIPKCGVRDLIFALVTIVLISGITIYLRNRINFDDLSFDQLATGGYYAYVLPDTLTEQSGSTRTIRMNSFTWQCEWHNELWNPVRVWYKDKSGKLALEINIEEQDAIFEDSKATETVICECRLDTYSHWNCLSAFKRNSPQSV